MRHATADKDKLCRGSDGSGPSLETSDVTLVWDKLKLTKTSCVEEFMTVKEN